MFTESIELLKGKGVKFEDGLTIYEIAQIEKIYDILLPTSLREFLMMALPVSKGFYNWRGEEPEDAEIFKMEVRKRLEVAPQLIPVFTHRYIPMVFGDNPPIISVHGADVIYMGKDLNDYFMVEYGMKKQTDISFNSITPIPFWSDLM